MNELYDLNFEETLLASFIYTNSPLEKVEADIFFSQINKSIYLALEAIEIQGLPKDELIIYNHLTKKMNLNEEQVSSSLVKILTLTPAVNYEHDIDRLKELYKTRNIKNSLLHIQNNIQNCTPVAELEASIHLLSENITTQSSNKLFNLTRASNIQAKEASFVTKSFIPVPENTVTIFSAGGGTGKSSLLLQLAVHYLYENPLEEVFCWLSEDPLEITKYRLNEIIKGLYPKGLKTINRLLLSDDLTFSVLTENNYQVGVNAAFYQMKIMLKKYKLIIFDPLIAFFGGDENNNVHAKMFMQLFTKWASDENKTIIFVHHSTKNTSQSRGASAFIDAARAVYEIEKIKDSNGKEADTTKRKVTITKDNYRASKYFNGFSKKIDVFPKTSKSTLYRDDLLVSCSTDDELGIK